MSGAGDNRWRRPGPGQAAANRGQSGGSGTSTPTRDAGKLQQQQAGSMTAASGNVWGGAAGKVKAGGVPAAGQVEQQSQTQQQHVPENEFNADEVREFLKKRYHETVGDLQGVHYKVQGDSVAKRGSGVWQTRGTPPREETAESTAHNSDAGNMSHLMPNGRDFFQELKKQLVALEQKTLEQKKGA